MTLEELTRKEATAAQTLAHVYRMENRPLNEILRHKDVWLAEAIAKCC